MAQDVGSRCVRSVGTLWGHRYLEGVGEGLGSHGGEAGGGDRATVLGYGETARRENPAWADGRCGRVDDAAVPPRGHRCGIGSFGDTSAVDDRVAAAQCSPQGGAGGPGPGARRSSPAPQRGGRAATRRSPAAAVPRPSTDGSGGWRGRVLGAVGRVLALVGREVGHSPVTRRVERIGCLLGQGQGLTDVGRGIGVCWLPEDVARLITVVHGLSCGESGFGGPPHSETGGRSTSRGCACHAACRRRVRACAGAATALCASLPVFWPAACWSSPPVRR